MKTMQETLDETIAAYTSETRAVNESIDEEGDSVGICDYLTDDGRMCAVGRCMIDPSLYSGDDNCTVIRINYREGGLDSVLKQEYRGFPLEFWRELQKLHDVRHNWDPEGLSPAGGRAASFIHRNY